MITYKELEEIVLLFESGISEEVISSIYNIKPKKIKKYYLKGKKVVTKDVDEAETADSKGSSSGTAAPAGPSNVTKWESGITRGRANQIDQNHKWESGIAKGRSNR